MRGTCAPPWWTKCSGIGTSVNSERTTSAGRLPANAPAETRESPSASAACFVRFIEDPAPSAKRIAHHVRHGGSREPTRGGRGYPPARLRDRARDAPVGARRFRAPYPLQTRLPSTRVARGVRVAAGAAATVDLRDVHEST